MGNGNTTRREVSSKLLSKKRHAKYVGFLACLAVVVTFGVTMVLRQVGRAATYEETVLDCHVAGNVAHAHDAGCYDADGNLVCQLPERELHTHDDSCYTTETRLVCGLQEHAHSDACYDEEGNLVCGLEEHAHSEACYETTRTLTCGKEEVTEAHQHGDGCFKTVTKTVADDEVVEEKADEAEDAAEAEMPAQSFTGKANGAKVTVEAPEGAFPAGTSMRVTAAEEAAEKAAESAVAETLDGEGEVKKVIAVDITFSDKDGNEVQPQVPIKVSIVNDEIAKGYEPVVVHVSDGDAKVVEQNASAKDEVAFDADSFSVYAVVIIDKDADTLEFETDKYLITVSYTKEAEIPYGTELEVKEITPDQDKYWELRKQTQDKINEGLTWEDTELTPDPRKGIADAVFFDVTLTYEGKEIEPKVPLAVEISYKDGGVALPEGETAKVIHFGDKKTEVIENVKVEKEADEATSFSFKQDSFSPVGTFTTDEYVEIKSLASPSAGILAAPALRAGDSSIAAEKTITDVDQDGVYELALRVTGQSESSSTTTVNKSNVVVVVDVSGSMTQNQTYSVYKGEGTSSGTYYGRVNNNYVRVYWRNPGGGYRWQYQTGTGYNARYYDYNGDVYFQETRLAATKTALKELVSALLANNKDEIKDGVDLNDIIEITLVKFAFAQETSSYNGTDTLIRNVNTEAEKGQINTIIDNLWAGGGTNWERALAQAKSEADRYKQSQPDEPVSVIFMTDGVPTSWGTTNTAGSESASNTHDAWNEADDDARSIVSAGYTLYNIFAFGTDTTKYNNDGNRTDADYLRALTNYAYSGTGTYANTTLSAAARPYFFNASDTSALQDAFNAIINSISGNVGFGGVEVDDGVTTGVTSTSVTVDGSVNTDKFRYTIKNGSTPLATVHIDGNTATFTIDNNEYTATGETVTTVIDGTTHTNTVFSVTVGDKTYKMSPASFDNNGKVQWDLAGIGIIENGYTYELTFDVWPNQLAYDMVADLNNGVKTLDQIKAEVIASQGQAVWDQIEAALVSLGNGKYAVRTNYEQYVDYYTVDTETNEQTGETTTTYTQQPRKELGPKDPVALTSSTMDMRKIWDDSLDQAQLNELLWKDGIEGGTSLEYSVKLHVWKADTLAELENQIQSYSEPTDGSYAAADEHDYLAKTLGWNGTEYSWADTLEVAPGTMIEISKAQEMGIDVSKHTQAAYGGKTYLVLESGHYYTVTEENIDRHFELNTIVYHPMLVDGVLSNVTFNADGSVESIVPMSTVDATNTLKGGINVLKRAFDGDTEILATNDTFTVAISMNNADGSGYLDWDYRIYYGENNPARTDTVTRSDHFFGTQAAMDASGSTGVVDPVNGGNSVITIDLYLGDTVRIINVPAGVTYTVQETAVNGDELVDREAGGYVNTSTTYEISEGAADQFQPDTPNEAGRYTVKGNHASQATVFNKVPAAAMAIKKIGGADIDNTLEGVTFKLYRDAEFNIQVTKDALGNPIGDADGVLTTGADGTVDIGTLLGGNYYLVETGLGDNHGYNMLAKPIVITVSDDDNYEQKVTYTQEGYSGAMDGNHDPATGTGVLIEAIAGTDPVSYKYTITVNNFTGVELPHTGGFGTSLFTIFGTAIAVAAILTYGLLSRRASEGRSRV